MRATDDRYRAEQDKFELAMRMIRHEARTGTIRYWTGLSADQPAHPIAWQDLGIRCVR
jgi:hypothetical protein